MSCVHVVGVGAGAPVSEEVLFYYCCCQVSVHLREGGRERGREGG